MGRGVGYEATENRHRGKEEIGTISLDAIYTPVKRVSFRVEQMRIRERTDFDRLILEIETDGTLSPETVLKEAAAILMRQFEIVGEGLKEEEIKPQESLKTKKKTAIKKTALKKKIAYKKKKQYEKTHQNENIVQKVRTNKSTVAKIVALFVDN